MIELNCLEIKKTSIKDYNKLAEYHYIKRTPQFYKNIYSIVGRDKLSNLFPNPLAVIVYCMPLMDIAARTKATDGWFKESPDRSSRLKRVNANISYIARVIVDPRFRRLGLATWLIQNTVDLQEVNIIESLTPLDWTNNMFVKCNFQLLLNAAPPYYRRFTSTLTKVGIHPQVYPLPDIVQNRINTLERDNYNLLDYEMSRFITHFRSRRGMETGIGRTAFVLSKLPYPPAYLIYRAKNEGTTAIK